MARRCGAVRRCFDCIRDLDPERQLLALAQPKSGRAVLKTERKDSETQCHAPEACRLMTGGASESNAHTILSPTPHSLSATMMQSENLLRVRDDFTQQDHMGAVIGSHGAILAGHKAFKQPHLISRGRISYVANEIHRRPYREDRRLDETRTRSRVKPLYNHAIRSA
jgi:hypothetical protein